MAKVDLQNVAAQIASKHGLSQKDAESFVSLAFTTISNGLDTEGLVKVKGFGTFKIVDVRDRESVNVNTGERVTISGHGKISFTPDAVIKDLINKPFAQFETVVINEGVDIEELNAVRTPEIKETEYIIDNTPVAEDVNTHENEDNLDSGISNDINEDNKPIVTSNVNQSESSESITNTIIEQETITPEVIGEESLISQDVDSDLSEETSNNVDDDIETELTEISNPLDMDVKDEKLNDTNSLSDKKTEIQQTIIPNINTEEEHIFDDREVVDSLDEDLSQKCFVGRHLWFLVLLFVVVALLAFCLGYYVGVNKANTDAQNIKPVITLTQNTSSVNNHKADTSNNINVSKTPAAVVQDTTKKSKQGNDELITSKDKDVKKTSQTPQKEIENNNSNKNLSIAQSMVRTGAYNIIGTECTIKVGKGETLKRISKFYLGDGMECYIQVHNGIEEVTEGMTLKIPRLKLKKKLKR